MGRRADQFWIFLRLTHDVLHRIDEGVERLARLGFCRLDHERTAHDQWKVDRWRMEAVVDEPLGDVECLNPRALLQLPIRKYCLVERLRLETKREKVGDIEVEYMDGAETEATRRVINAHLYRLITRSSASRTGSVELMRA